MWESNYHFEKVIEFKRKEIEKRSREAWKYTAAISKSPKLLRQDNTCVNCCC
ncbi:MAG: hypothetical protein K0R93_2710 [Anaerosolibacter sp.]|jgi:hypothetical protein|uniref:hypothetical protein n=1 Tax=Anaerosolibacter sp. TaxID=1872527 RepID=UPI002621F06A|nr:hypothetical protein [Anaerosolibacter sp.]MDF2547812.1 hypothetical protein [Anaerosolibacter sp.]